LVREEEVEEPFLNQLPQEPLIEKDEPNKFGKQELLDVPAG